MLRLSESWVLALVIAVPLFASCASKAPPAAANVAITEVTVASLYPLDQGWKWAYTVSAEGKPPVLATYVVIERTGAMAVVKAGDERITYLTGTDSLVRKDELGGDALLKPPFAVGSSWLLAGGGEARIVAADKEVTVEAGRFQHCVVVEETRSAPRRMVRTTYAPGAGPVQIEMLVDEGAGLVPSVRASLLGVTRPGEDPTADVP